MLRISAIGSPPNSRVRPSASACDLAGEVDPGVPFGEEQAQSRIRVRLPEHRLDLLGIPSPGPHVGREPLDLGDRHEAVAVHDAGDRSAHVPVQRQQHQRGDEGGGGQMQSRRSRDHLADPEHDHAEDRRGQHQRDHPGRRLTEQPVDVEQVVSHDRHRDRGGDQDHHGHQHRCVGDVQRDLEADRHDPPGHQQPHDRHPGQHQPAHPKPPHLVARPVPEDQRHGRGDQAGRHQQQPAHQERDAWAARSALRSPDRRLCPRPTARRPAAPSRRRTPPGPPARPDREPPVGEDEQQGEQAREVQRPQAGRDVATTLARDRRRVEVGLGEHVQGHHERDGPAGPGQGGSGRTRGTRRTINHAATTQNPGVSSSGRKVPEKAPALLGRPCAAPYADQPDGQEPRDGGAERQRTRMRRFHSCMLARVRPAGIGAST